MKKYIIIVFILVGSLQSVVAVFASDVPMVIEAITSAKPKDWQLGQIDYANRPWWSRSNETCVKFVLFGPALGRRQYYTNSGQLIEEKRFMNEAITVWVTPEGFDSGWNFLSRFFYRFRPDNQGFPVALGEYKGVKVFGQETYYALPQNEKLNRMPSPEGTHASYFLPPVGGRAWSNWQSELILTIKKISPTSKD